MIATQQGLSARKNQRSPGREERPDPAASPKAGPVRQEKSSTSHFPSPSCESRYVCSGATTAVNAWS